MHDEVAQHVLRAPLAFFHTNPTGRILNRFSKDQGTADDHLPQVAFDATQSLFLVAGKRSFTHFTYFARFAVLPESAHTHVCCFVYNLLGIYLRGEGGEGKPDSESNTMPKRRSLLSTFPQQGYTRHGSTHAGTPSAHLFARSCSTLPVVSLCCHAPV